MNPLLNISSFPLSLSAFAWGDSMYVSGSIIHISCKYTILLHGTNYKVFDDRDIQVNMNTGSKRFSKIEKTGANSVTIEWYDNYGNVLSNAYAFKDLDSLLTRRPDYKIITIPGLWNHFPQIITTRWNDPRVLSLQQ